MHIRWWNLGVLSMVLACLWGSCIQQSAAQKQDQAADKKEAQRTLVSLPAIPLDSIRDSSSTHLRFRAIGGAEIMTAAINSEKQFAVIYTFLDETASAFDLSSSRIHLYPSVEAKGIITQNTRVAHFDDQNTIHRIAHPAFADHEDEILPLFLIRQYLNKPKHHFLERGLAVFMTQHWREKGYQYWASVLIHSGNSMPLSELLNNDLLEKESDLVTSCMAGVWAEFLLKKWGKQAFLDQYNSFSPDKKEIIALEAEFDSWAKAQFPRPELSRKKEIPQGLRGFNFTHEGYNIDNGYSGNMAACSLDTLCHTGGNAIALVPYSYMRDPESPSFLPFMRRHPGTETDEGIIYCMYQAQQRDMFCMLKPQLWLGRGSWPGDVHMRSDADWEAFFDYYHRWMRHYALLATMYDADAFCTGVEFARATQERPEDWRRLVNRLRGMYSGIITYAANWGEEFQALAFADALDVVGLNCYYPLGKRDSMDQQQLQKAFTGRLVQIQRQSKKWGRPVWLTELGYASLAMPWKQPHAEPKNLPSSPEHQARCYEATLAAIAEADWPVSQFWWKWSTDPKSAHLHDKEFIPIAKPAQQVLRRMWKR